MPATFISGPGWEQSSEPIVTRMVHLTANDATALVWPVGAPFDTLTDGEHPILAIGRKANRPHNITGVVMTYDSRTNIAVFNVADKFISVQYVCNIAGYTGTVPNAWQNVVYPGDPVFVDDSADVAAAGAGCTLSFSPLNDTGTAENPLAGYVWWCQDEYADGIQNASHVGVGGPNTTQQINQPAVIDTTEVLTLCVQQVNDCGVADFAGR